MRLKIWIQAFRLRTLPLAFSSILMGTVLAYSKGFFRYDIMIWSLLTTLFLQVLSNLANDYGDADSGVDGAHREGPKRTVSSGLISKSSMKRALIICSLLSLLSGVYLVFLAFGDDWQYVLLFLLVGLGAIAASIKYTVGKNPYGYSGFGDLFVLLFFGIVGVGGTYFLYSHTFTFMELMPAMSCGLLAVGVLNVNNIRDIESDTKSGKQSIPVRIGRSAAVHYHWILLGSAMLFSVCFLIIKGDSLYAYVFTLVLPLLIVNARAVKIYKDAKSLDPYLRQLAMTTLLFVLLFGVGQLLN